MKHSRPVPRLGFTRTELAASIGISPNSVDAMVREGFLPPPRLWHTRKIWIISEVEAAMYAWPTIASLPDFQSESAEDWRVS